MNQHGPGHFEHPSIGGSSGLENLYVVDGVTVTDMAYGSLGTYNVNYGSLSSGINLAFIKEVDVKSYGFAPQYGKAQGGIVLMVTKSAEREGVGSRTLAELIATQALSRRYLDGADGPAAVNMIQDILGKSNRVDIFTRACEAMIAMDLRPLLPKIKAPTLVIGGDEDIMTPWQQAASGAGQEYLVQHIDGAEKYVIKGSGHSTLFDGTEENCRIVTAFLKGEF